MKLMFLFALAAEGINMYDRMLTGLFSKRARQIGFDPSDLWKQSKRNPSGLLMDLLSQQKDNPGVATY